MAKDPIGFAGGDANLYAYVGGDPVNAVDPTGLEIRVYSSDAFGMQGLNHAFVYSTETGRAHGRDGMSGHAWGNGAHALNNPYAVVTLPQGMTESNFMDQIDSYSGWNSGVWFPWGNDCHNDLEGAFDNAKVPFPGAPNDRLDIDDIIQGLPWSIVPQNWGAVP